MAVGIEHIPPGEITALLKAWRAGDQQAFEQLTSVVYDHLRRLARQHSRKEGATMRADATGLLHDMYVRLVQGQAVDWQDRTHFFAVSATIMRRILVDAARSRATTKRGGDLKRVDHSTAMEFDQFPAEEPAHAAMICALDDALLDLAHRNPRSAHVVELRFFGGLTVNETAEALGISPQTVMRDWKLARAWLERELARA